MSNGAVEEIPSCGWNWMGSSEGRDGGGGDTWCRGCCQSPDSRAFVFSIITRSTSFSSFLPFHESSVPPSLFQFFPEASSIVNQCTEPLTIEPCDQPEFAHVAIPDDVIPETCSRICSQTKRWNELLKEAALMRPAGSGEFTACSLQVTHFKYTI